MRHDGVSEILGAIFLIAVAALAMGIIVVILLSRPLPTNVPAFTGLITNSSTTVFITHEGGDPLYPGTFQVLVDGKDETSNFTKSITGPFTLGKVMSATLPSMAGRVVLVFNTSWGGGIILASADLGTTIPYTPPGWYDGAWKVRKKITIDHNQVQGSHTDFPVLLSFADNGLKNNASSTGSDILFTKDDGTTKIPHEIESYTSNNGAFLGWVRVPQISSSSDTVIFMYYGNQGAPGQWNNASVWTNGYAGVWHLDEASGTRMDSTNNHNNLNDMNTVGQTGGSKIYNSAFFNGLNSERLQITDAAQTGLNPTTAITLEAWAMTNYVGTEQAIIQKSKSCSNYPPYALRLRNGDATHSKEYGSFSSDCLSSTFDATGSTTSIDANTWYHLAVTYDGSNVYLYKNGVQTGTKSQIGSLYVSTNDFTIGSRVGGVDNYYFNGSIDEARVSNVARTVDWLLTEYRNMDSPATFLSVESTEQDQYTMRW